MPQVFAYLALALVVAMVVAGAVGNTDHAMVLGFAAVTFAVLSHHDTK